MEGVPEEILEVEGLDDIDVHDTLEGCYNRGLVVDNEYGFEGELVERPEEVVVWSPLPDTTPEMETQDDLLSYHLARYRNAEVMRNEGLEVPAAEVIGGETGDGYASFLVTAFLDHDCFDQRPKVPGGDPRRNNPHTRDPYDNPERRSFEAGIDKAIADIDGEQLVTDGEIVNAGGGSIDDHNKNWGLYDGGLVRLDIGEVPAEGPVWNPMPYGGPEEFYRGEGIREEAEALLYDLGVDPDYSLEFRGLM